jgi:hypothetical protein
MKIAPKPGSKFWKSGSCEKVTVKRVSWRNGWLHGPFDHPLSAGAPVKSRAVIFAHGGRTYEQSLEGFLFQHRPVS